MSIADSPASGLIAPHGGSLVDLMVAADQREAGRPLRVATRKLQCHTTTHGGATHDCTGNP